MYAQLTYKCLSPAKVVDSRKAKITKGKTIETTWVIETLSDNTPKAQFSRSDKEYLIALVVITNPYKLEIYLPRLQS